RELTKLHEEVWRGTLEGALERAGQGAPRGEHTIVLAGAPPPPPLSDDELEEVVGAALAAGRPTREAAALAAACLGVPRRRAYDKAVSLRERARDGSSAGSRFEDGGEPR
ncbi:MAG: 16S rRNA (cytidine(1402)-2'-O)-methyltransferase, partial [Acidimicrobiales bacterium]